uniref:Uncharacterized protein n=1 Tax=Scleropages formosus TaxID=113540 RepID=A0A8C9RU74_SCLFO
FFGQVRHEMNRFRNMARICSGPGQPDKLHYVGVGVHHRNVFLCSLAESRSPRSCLSVSKTMRSFETCPLRSSQRGPSIFGSSDTPPPSKTSSPDRFPAALWLTCQVLMTGTVTPSTC